jgi:hypothetical protein
VSPQQAAFAQRRRSTRIDQAIPILVQGVGAMREPYQEQVSTLTISCHGCTYQSKHEVIQGETVYLDIKVPKNGSAGCSNRARVKWAQKLGSSKERTFQIAVELEIAGNVWGIATPPTDWFPPQIPEGTDSTAPGRELKVVSRKEQSIVPAAEGGMDRVARSERKEPVASPSGPLAQLMVGLGEQIQAMASQAASAALVTEKSRLLEEFRVQLRGEAVKAIQSAISASKEVLARQAMKELSEAHEAGARNSYALWRKKIEQDMETVRQHMLTQVKEVNRHLDGLTASAIERAQQNMEATRTEAVERFVSRIREQVAPMLEVAKDSLQRLDGAGAALREESEAIFAGLENQLAFTTNESLAKALEDLERNTAAHTAKTNETLQKLYQNFEKAAHDNAGALLASAGSQMSGILQERAAEVSREFATGLEGYTRNYLESIGKSIAEIPQNVPVRSGR